MLAMLGVPPLLGFLGRWRLYDAALQFHPALAAVFILSSILALVAYVLALTRNWWGPAQTDAPAGAQRTFPSPGRHRRPGGRAAGRRRLAAVCCNFSKGVADETVESIDVLLPSSQPVALPYELGKLQRMRH